MVKPVTWAQCEEIALKNAKDGERPQQGQCYLLAESSLPKDSRFFLVGDSGVDNVPNEPMFFLL